ncbi:spermatogenesis-associated protein 7 homolog isoform X2 [Heptranchias perlo]|uniref:spermatogenesis-associated protein 7 homolog isoform X2 n=1 Tax=Heptranchias perlo TaxID=212740 RepID=UPI003559C7BA
MISTKKGLQSAMIPKYSLMGPFKGHMCTKSSPFCSGSSCKLATQFIIQDHMAVHYNNLISAKAAVDSSVPKSMSTSIKYTDQQKRERLKKVVKKYQKEILHLRSTSQINSKSVSPATCRILSAKELSSMNKIACNPEKSPNTFYSDLPAEQANTDCFYTQERTIADLFPFKSPKPASSVTTIARETVQDIITWGSSPHLEYRMSNHGRSVIPCNRSVQLIDKHLMNRPFQDPQKKTFSGDILDKHSNRFTEEKQPFTPRILKKTAKSFLSKYRYYTAPKNMQVYPNVTTMSKGSSIEASIDRLTEMSLLQDHLDTDCAIWCETQEHRPTRLTRTVHRSTTVKSKLMAWEDELKYLQFLKEVTDDILIRGYHSNKILENVFQRHIERSKYHLNEGKLKNMLQNLRNELQTDPTVSYSEYSTTAQKPLLNGKHPTEHILYVKQGTNPI